MDFDTQLLQVIKKLMLTRYPRFGSQIASINLEYNTDLPYHTAATDGKTIYFDPNFFVSLNDEERLFIIAHELMHIKFEHMYRMIGKDGVRRDPKIWNIATDAIINANLERDGFKIREGAINMPEAINYNAEEFYEKLLKENQKQQEKQSGNGGQQDQNSQGQEQNGQGQSENGQNQGQQEHQQQGQENGQGNQENQDQQQNGEGQGQGQSSEQSSQQQSGNGQAQSQSGEQNQGQEQNGQASGNAGQQSQGQGEQSIGSGDGFTDDHSLWEKAFEERNQQQNNKPKSNADNKSDNKSNKSVDKDSQNNKNSDSTSNSFRSQSSKSGGIGDGEMITQNASDLKNDSSIEREAKIDEKNEFQHNRTLRRELAKQRFEQMKNQQLKKNESGNVELKDIGQEKAILDWKLLLRREVEKTETIWSQRRSIAENNYAYRLEENDIEDEAETEVMIDVSGSVSNEMVRSFLRQLKPILKTSKLKVGFFADYATKEFQEIKKDRDIDNLKIYRPGYGTNMDAAVRAFSKKRETNKLVFTDGYPGTEPKSDLEAVNVIWLVYENRDFHPCCGKVIDVHPKDLQNMVNTQLHVKKSDLSL